ncbi:hypothetical protein HOC13_04855 [Candidatus Woesearchaeota archaeon]|jgi:hypothetical protein|nr:hypothetical protein [Candidatus Woesearchaeota archaeon]
MTCNVCGVNIEERDLSFCGSCEELKERWEIYCKDNNNPKEKNQSSSPGKKIKWKKQNKIQRGD